MARWSDIESAISGAFPPDLDGAYPGIRDALLSELALLRRKARALDELALRVQGRWPCVLVQLHSDHSDNSGMMLEAYGTQKSDDTFKYIIRETDFLSAIEKAMEP